jgi:hypothetical protein
VLRYAAPAVALFAFAAIVLVVVTRNRDVTSLVTQNEPNRTQSSDTKTAAPNDGQSTNSTTSQVDNNHGNTSSATNANASSQNSATSPAQAAQREAQPQTETPVVDGVGTTTSNTASVAANEPQPPPARIQERGADSRDAAKPAQQPDDVLAANRAKEKDDEFAVEQKRAENNEAAAGGAPAAASPTNTTTRRGRKAEGAGGGAYGMGRTETSDEERQRPQTAKSAPAATAGARRDTSGRDEDSTAETRTVAGRRFRQQNGVWVDTAYSSSRSVIRVRRGSEQYRALVADEPVIGTVANSFSGDVIVVVRGKAYRITQ